MHEHLINYTPGYVLEELEEQPLVDNPELRELKKRRAGLAGELNRLKVELANHALKPPAKKRRTPLRSEKEARDDITVVEGKILLVDEQLDKLPSEVRFDQAHAGEKLLKLNHEKKRFLDGIQVFVCNVEAEMCRLLLKHYDWHKEVVPALAMIVERTGHVKLEGGRLGGGKKLRWQPALFFWRLASLLTRYRSRGYAPRSRLARRQNPRGILPP